MEWNSTSIEKLEIIFREKYILMFHNTPAERDRKNRSAIWNKYIKNYDCKLIRNDIRNNQMSRKINQRKQIRSVGIKERLLPNSNIILNNLIDFINFKNDFVANSLIISNPDRLNQYILIPRDMAEKILAIGMI